MLTRPDGTQFSWDYEGRLSQAVLPNGGGTVTFHYDPFGKRIQKSGPLGTTNYFYDGANTLETADQNGNALASYTGTHLMIDEPLAELAAGTTGYYEQDALGTVTSLTDVNGNPLNTYSYDSFGNLIASTIGLTNPLQYTGREFDQETNAYYYRNRYYDPVVGRFASEDPLGPKAGGANLYAYTQNRPVNYGDPFGLCPPVPTPWTCNFRGRPLLRPANCAYACVPSDGSFGIAFISPSLERISGSKAPGCSGVTSCPTAIDITGEPGNAPTLVRCYTSKQ